MNKRAFDAGMIEYLEKTASIEKQSFLKLLKYLKTIPKFLSKAKGVAAAGGKALTPLQLGKMEAIRAGRHLKNYATAAPGRLANWATKGGKDFASGIKDSWGTTTAGQKAIAAGKFAGKNLAIGSLFALPSYLAQSPERDIGMYQAGLSQGKALQKNPWTTPFEMTKGLPGGIGKYVTPMNLSLLGGGYMLYRAMKDQEEAKRRESELLERL